LIILNLPQYPHKIRTDGQSKQIFDGLRRKYVALTPEEWVRQHFIQYLIIEKKYPASYMSVEKSLKVNTLQKRTDIVIHDKTGKPWMIVECKSPDVEISEETFYQAGRYNLKLKVTFLVLTNGLQHFCLRILNDKVVFEDELPLYTE
jgi:hypothetical protein